MHPLVLAATVAVAASMPSSPATMPSSGAATSRPAAAMPSPQGVFFIEHFDDADLPSRQWYDGNRFNIVGGAQAGKGCLEYAWSKAGSSNVSGSTIRRLLEPTDEVYVKFYLRLSKGWGWTGKGYHPHMMNLLTTENDAYFGPAKTHLTLYVEAVDGKMRVGGTDIQNAKMPHGLTQGPLKGGYNGTLYDSKDVLFTDDKWHCLEAYFKLNSLDLKNDRPNADGIARGWFDGKLVIDKNDIVLRSTDFPKMKINQYLIAPHFGPGLLPHPQTLWIDELTVAKKREGM